MTNNLTKSWFYNGALVINYIDKIYIYIYFEALNARNFNYFTKALNKCYKPIHAKRWFFTKMVLIFIIISSHR